MTQSSLQVELLPVFDDNYIFILYDEKLKIAAAVDPALAKPVLDFVQSKGLLLTQVWNTHHHFDHIGGNLELVKTTGCEVYGSAADSKRIPGISKGFRQGDSFLFAEQKVQILETFGHTIGHICFWLEEDQTVFVGDTLFPLGCGRLFEGQAEQMFLSISKLATLPAETKVYSAHEYTLANAKFAVTVDPDNQDLKVRIAEFEALRSKDLPTIPTTIAQEQMTNPFMRAENAEVFAKIRTRKDRF